MQVGFAQMKDLEHRNCIPLIENTLEHSELIKVTLCYS